MPRLLVHGFTLSLGGYRSGRSDGWRPHGFVGINPTRQQAPSDAQDH
ncbi:MAG TPA: hypothetical protein PKY96_18105 [Flavobacteriales bacterium]|nr:hypothetical protein [Flavobacteriales bacterium]